MTDLFLDQVPFLEPWLGEEEAAAARDVILSGWVSMGPKTAEFERAIADLVGSAEGVATNSATTALHLALTASGVEAGDEVLVPTFTCMATANAVILAGAIPRFVDIDSLTYNIDPALIEDRITDRTVGVMAVDQIGLPSDLDAIRAIADRKSLLVFEDGATALGATYQGRYVGGLGVPTVFSFHPRKMITTGEGGMLLTDDERLAERARVIRSTGASVSDLERHRALGRIVQQYHTAGTNYRLTDIQAAIGLVQLAKLSRMLAERRRQATVYDVAFADFEGVVVPFVPDNSTHAYSSYCIRLLPETKITPHEVVLQLADEGVSSRHGIQPLHLEPYFALKTRDERFPVSERAAAETMFLPIYPGLTEEDQTRVLAGVTRALGRV